MILTVPGWSGRFDVDVDFNPGTPASYGPNGGDPGDQPDLELELIVWEFSPYDCIVIEKQIDHDLHQSLIAGAWAEIERDPEPWYRGDDTEFYDLQELG